MIVWVSESASTCAKSCSGDDVAVVAWHQTEGACRFGPGPEDPARHPSHRRTASESSQMIPNTEGRPCWHKEKEYLSVQTYLPTGGETCCISGRRGSAARRPAGRTGGGPPQGTGSPPPAASRPSRRDLSAVLALRQDSTHALRGVLGAGMSTGASPPRSRTGLPRPLPSLTSRSLPRLFGRPFGSQDRPPTAGCATIGVRSRSFPALRGTAPEPLSSLRQDYS